jgi:predicted transposase YbfD/YdcC
MDSMRGVVNSERSAFAVDFSGRQMRKEVAALVAMFADLPDPRVIGRCAHDLLDIVVLALCAVMSGAEGWDDIEDWGVERQAWLQQYLKLRNGIPGHDTIRRVFEALSPAALESRFVEWVQGVCGAVDGRVIAIDGKALRGSRSVARGTGALHLVSAYAAEMGLSLGQQPCEAKSNEIEAIKQLLPALALKRAVVTIDAIGCQSEIARLIVYRPLFSYALGGVTWRHAREDHHLRKPSLRPTR